MRNFTKKELALISQTQETTARHIIDLMLHVADTQPEDAPEVKPGAALRVFATQLYDAFGYNRTVN